MDIDVAEISKFMEAHNAFVKSNDERLAAIEKKGSADIVLVEKVDRINTALDQFEKANQENTAAVNLAKKLQEDMAGINTALATLEAKMKRPGLFNSTDEERAHYKSNVQLWVRSVVGSLTVGEANLKEDQRKALANVEAEAKALGISQDVTGGYLAPTQLLREMIKTVTEISPVRSLVRVRSTVNRSVQIPTRTGQFAAVWVADEGTKAETDGLRWGMREIPTHEFYALIDISNQNLEDSAWDLESEVRGEAAEQFALAEGTAVVAGSGTGRPEGWMTNASVSETNSGAAAAVTADGLLTLKHAIKTFYTANANWTLNRTTLGSVRKLKDGNGQYLWMPGIANGKPNTIDGDPYVEVPDMPNEGAGLYPVAYGDFRRAYTLVDRIAMEMLRDPYTQATSGRVRFIFRRRLGGQVLLPEAIRKLKCSV